jgi:hypothetical protein
MGQAYPPPPRRRRRTILVVAAGVVALLVVLGIIGAVVGGSSNGSSKQTAGSTTAGDGTSLVDSQGISLRLPQGWKAVPLDPSQVQKFLSAGGEANPAIQKSLSAQVKAAVGQHLRLFAVRSATLAGGFTDNVNVAVVSAPGATPAEIATTATSTLESSGATVTDHATITLPHGQGERLDYTLPLSSGGKTVTVQGEQVYEIFGDQVAIITLSTKAVAVDEADFQEMLNSFALT